MVQYQSSRIILIDDMDDIMANQILNKIKDLTKTYPDIENWFNSKVRIGVENGERKILLSLTNNDISGVSIIKQTTDEDKLCLIRVDPKYKRNGIGHILFDKSIELLEDDKPYLTISEDNIEELHKIIQYYGWKKDNILNGIYKKNVNEIEFNRKD